MVPVAQPSQTVLAWRKVFAAKDTQRNSKKRLSYQMGVMAIPSMQDQTMEEPLRRTASSLTIDGLFRIMSFCWSNLYQCGVHRKLFNNKICL